MPLPPITAFFKQRFLDYLPAWYERQPQAWAYADAVGNTLQDAWQVLDDIRKLHAHIRTSTGANLDWWGRDFKVYRDPGEDDFAYRERIVSVLAPRKVTKQAILDAVNAHYLSAGYTPGVDYTISLDEYQKLSFRINIKFLVNIEDPKGILVAKIIKETRAAGIYAKLSINGNFYIVNTAKFEGFLTTNKRDQTGLNAPGDLLGPVENTSPGTPINIVWGGFLLTNGAGHLNSTYTMGSTYQVQYNA